VWRAWPQCSSDQKKTTSNADVKHSVDQNTTAGDSAHRPAAAAAAALPGVEAGAEAGAVVHEQTPKEKEKEEESGTAPSASAAVDESVMRDDEDATTKSSLTRASSVDTEPTTPSDDPHDDQTL
jgi:hypothetical protein